MQWQPSFRWAETPGDSTGPWMLWGTLESLQLYFEGAISVQGKFQRWFWLHEAFKSSLETHQQQWAVSAKDVFEKWSVSCHINKWGGHSHQWFQPPKATRENNTCQPEATGLQPLPKVSSEGKCRMLAQDSWDACERNDFSEPRLLHLPIHRKVLNSLTWDWIISNQFISKLRFLNWFSLIHKDTFDIRTICPLLQTTI